MVVWKVLGALAQGGNMSIDMKAWGDQSYNVTGYITKLLSDVCKLWCFTKKHFFLEIRITQSCFWSRGLPLELDPRPHNYNGVIGQTRDMVVTFIWWVPLIYDQRARTASIRKIRYLGHIFECTKYGRVGYPWKHFAKNIYSDENEKEIYEVATMQTWEEWT